MNGIKDDGGKLRWDLYSWGAATGTVEVLTFGAAKYEQRNWEKGIEFSRVFAALMRHMTAWWTGQDKDAESGLPHLDHAACCLHFLQHYQHGDYAGFDDRPDMPGEERLTRTVAVATVHDCVKALRAHGEEERACALEHLFHDA